MSRGEKEPTELSAAVHAGSREPTESHNPLRRRPVAAAAAFTPAHAPARPPTRPLADFQQTTAAPAAAVPAPWRRPPSTPDAAGARGGGRGIRPRNGHTLVAGIVARISGCANQKEVSLDDQVDHAKQELADVCRREGGYAGPVAYDVIATRG